MKVYLRLLVVASLLVFEFSGRVFGQEDIADISSEDLRAQQDESKRYFLVGPHKGRRSAQETGLDFSSRSRVGTVAQTSTRSSSASTSTAFPREMCWRNPWR